MKKLFFLLITILPFSGFSQEVLTGLHLNPVLKNSSSKPSLAKSNVIYDTIPYIDDFSKNINFPNPSHWTNSNVFINQQYGINPATIGVATFDALDSDGKLYKNANFDQFGADTLSSIAIKLDSIYTKGQKSIAIKRSDSLYFSFLYQPGGLGNAPDIHDSLVLEFYSPSDGKWRKAWSSAGITFAAFKTYLDTAKTKTIGHKYHNNDSTFYFLDSLLHNKFKVDFKVIMLPIKDSAKYYQKGFKFRFRNYASVADNYLPTWGAGNVDIWNIDYIYINVNRSVNEKTLNNDIGFYKGTKSFINNYTSIPWKQYLANPVAETKTRDKIGFSYTNFFNKELLVDQQLIITDLSKVNPTFKLDIDANGNMPPVSDTTYIPQLLNYTFPDNHKKNCEFEVLAYVKSNIQGRDINPENDTIRFKQIFDNYYAYDDGNPEAGYGLSVAGGMLAYRFDMDSIPDTLSSVAIFFNSTYKNINQKPFSLMIWDESKGLPNKLLFNKNNFLPVDSGFDLFKIYHLDTTLILTKKTFFVGIKQSTKDNLNIGFDFNNNNQTKLFYNTTGTWYQSIYSGSLMIRPVFGKYLNEGINELSYNKSFFSVYPNPITGKELNIKLLDAEHKDSYNIEIYSSMGAKVYSSKYKETISLAELSNGIYFLRLFSVSDNISYTKKIIKE